MYKKVQILCLCFCVLLGSVIISNNREEVVTTGYEPPNTWPILIIDAGHGGLDSGTIGVDGTLEKDVNLSISKIMNQMAILMGCTTIMTRTDDGDIGKLQGNSIRKQKQADIRTRLKTIESIENCIVLSVHQNYYQQPQYYGLQTFYTTNNNQNQSIANSIQTNVCTLLQPNNTRKIKTIGSEIYLLHHCTKPAVMVECGFMSNKTELELLKSQKYQANLAYIIIDSVIQHINS